MQYFHFPTSGGVLSIVRFYGFSSLAGALLGDTVGDKYAAGGRRGPSAPAAGAGGAGVQLHGGLQAGGAPGHIGRHGHVDRETVPGGGGIPHGAVGEGGKGDGAAVPTGTAAAAGAPAAATAAAVEAIAHMSIPQNRFGRAGTGSPPHSTVYACLLQGVTKRKARRGSRGGLLSIPSD